MVLTAHLGSAEEAGSISRRNRLPSAALPRVAVSWLRLKRAKPALEAPGPVLLVVHVLAICDVVLAGIDRRIDCNSNPNPNPNPP